MIENIKPDEIIKNRFSPASSSPIFFSGRKEEIAKLILKLNEFYNDYYTKCPNHIYIIKGEHGIGKTTFLLKFKKQINQKFPQFIPIYISTYNILESPSSFIEIFLKELENLIIPSPQRREIFVKKLKNWESEAKKISPLINEALNKSVISSFSINNIFKILREAYKSPEDIEDLFLFVNWFLEKTDSFILLILDHVEYLKSFPEVLEILLNSFKEFDKYYRRFFLILSIEDKSLESILKGSKKETSKSILQSLLKNHTVINILNKERLNKKCELLCKKIFSYEKIIFINISNELSLENILSLFKNRCKAYNFCCIQIEYLENINLKTYIKDSLLNIKEELSDILKDMNLPLSLSERELPYECNDILENIEVENKLDNIFNLYFKFLKIINKFLNKLENIKLILYLNNFEKILLSFNESSIFSSHKISPNLTGLKFLSLIQQNSIKLNNIYFIPILYLPSQEIKEEKFKIEDIFKKEIIEFFPLSQEDSILLLKEIFAKSLIFINDEIALDIYSKCGGFPLFLQYYGFYIVLSIQKKLTSKELAGLKGNLLSIYEPSKHKSISYLAVCPDKRVRYNLKQEYYKEIVPSNIEELYKRLLNEIRYKFSKVLLKVLSEEEEFLTYNYLLNRIQEYYPETQKNELISEIKHLESLKILITHKDKVSIAHPHFKEVLKDIFYKKETSRNITTKQKVVPSLRNLTTRRLIPSSKFQTIKRAHTDITFIEKSIKEIENGIFLSYFILEELSKRISTINTSPVYKITMNLIYSLCNQYIKELNLEIDISKTIGEFKNYLSEPDLAKEGPSLCVCIKKFFLDNEIIDENLNNYKYSSVSKIYFLRYYLFKDMEDLKKSIEYLVLASIEGPSEILNFSSNLYSFLNKSKILDKEPYLNLLNLSEKLIEIHSLGINETKYRIKEFLPNKIEKNLYKYIVLFIKKLIKESGNTTIISTCIDILKYYGNIIKEDNEIIDLLIELYSNTKEIIILKNIINTLCRILPFLNDKDKEKIRDFLEESAVKCDILYIKNFILDKIGETYLTFSPDNIASFLHGFIQTEENLESKEKAWYKIINLRYFCSKDIQQELIPLLLEFYVSLLKSNNIPFYKVYNNLKALLSILKISKEKEYIKDIILHSYDYLLKNINKLPYQKGYILKLIYPLLDSNQKKDIENIFSKLNDDKLEYYSLLPYIEIKKIDKKIPDIISKSIKYIPYLNSIDMVLLISRLEEKDKCRIWDILFKSLSNILKIYDIKNSALINNCKYILETLILINSFYPKENKEDLAYILQEILKKNIYFKEVLENFIYLIPYLDFEIKKEFFYIFKNILERELLIENKLNLENFSYILEILSYLHITLKGRIDDKYSLSILNKIKDKMNIHPSKVLKSALKFYEALWNYLPENIIEPIIQDAINYLYIYEFAEESSIFLARCLGANDDLLNWAYIYQYNTSTYHIAFCLYEAFIDILGNSATLTQNYEKVCQMNSPQLALDMANFHLQIKKEKRGMELLEWLLNHRGIHIYKLAALKLLRKWYLWNNKTEEADKTLEKYINVIYESF